MASNFSEYLPHSGFHRPSGAFRRNRQFRQNRQSPRGHFWYPVQIAIFAIACISGHKCPTSPQLHSTISSGSRFSPSQVFVSMWALAFPFFLILHAQIFAILQSALLHSWRKILTIQLPPSSPSSRQTLLTLSRCGLHTHSLR